MALNKPIIAVDIDDVLCDLNENIRHFMNREYGFEHGPNDYDVEGQYWGYWGPIWGVDGDEYHKRLDSYTSSGELSKQKLLLGAKDAIKELKERFDLVVITSRLDENRQETQKWLEKHFKSLFKDVHFAVVWNQGEKAEKAEICQAIGARYLIDDNAHHCNTAAEAGVKSLLFGDYGWNRRTVVHPDVLRVKNWKAVLEYFDAESR